MSPSAPLHEKSLMTCVEIGKAVTASFGIANYPEDAAGTRALLHLADESMYRSKRGGKNLVTTCDTGGGDR